jgi:probable HAF family extracellular repeat protein
MQSNLAKVLLLSLVMVIGCIAQPVSNCWSATERTLIDLGIPPGYYNLRINNHGQVLVAGPDTEWVLHTWLWKDGQLSELVDPGGFGSWASALNESGQLAGGFNYCQDDPDLGYYCVSHALRFGNAGMTDLGTLGGPSSDASLINDRGQIAGGSETSDGKWRAFLWENGTMTDLGSLGCGYSVALVLNERGQVAGQSCTSADESYAFLWEKGTMTSLGALGGPLSYPEAMNNHGQVVGTLETASYDSHAFLWENGTMTDLGTLPGGSWSQGCGINERGQAVGFSETSDCYYNRDEQWICAWHAFLWEKGTMTDLGTLGGHASLTCSINDAGQIVGLSTTAAGERHAFLWDKGTMIDLGTPGGPDTSAAAITNGGKILGYNEIPDPADPYNIFYIPVLWTK